MLTIHVNVLIHQEETVPTVATSVTCTQRLL